MATTQAEFMPSTADEMICNVVGRANDGTTLTAVANALFPRYSPQWVRERCRRLAMAGMLEIDRTCRPAVVRLAERWP